MSYHKHTITTTYSKARLYDAYSVISTVPDLRTDQRKPLFGGVYSKRNLSGLKRMFLAHSTYTYICISILLR